MDTTTDHFTPLALRVRGNHNNKCSDVKVVNYPARRTMKRTLPAASVIIIIMNQRLQGPCAASSMICSLALVVA